ncbi:hypothetical protein CR205_14030 [Alteribacter lacisalsi]|uniref:Uncharacterized protein n=1 Tax=Alteribacter lacisalsi TaxID=2045244 RepID=A0A2W0H7T2_9BACI|nr:hypothetical protein [Alteribacter lacisalsi]PYZ96796.1 hypothetical protein CR205_14030 [Alteribacter lacisalsi]
MYYTKEEIRMMLDHLSDEEISKVYNYIHALKKNSRRRRSIDASRKSGHAVNGSMKKESSRSEVD